ncbi:SbcC/MukB-like Walker B domain-containing protein, partial [Marmoricola sp. RAF53]|uniref:SbcC/MukB-like Walker B domain-containing protein n=1 Tax=Marmoricola sp. RAF53 TaxID=3233059 RepID=UPI003F997F51
ALHHRAAPVSALARRGRRSAAAAASADDAWQRCAPDLAVLLPGSGEDEPARPALVGALRDAQQSLAEARAFLPRERELRAHEDRCAALRADLDGNAEALAAVEALLDLLPASHAAAEGRREAAAAASAALPGAEAEAERLDGLVTAVARLQATTEELVGARAALLDATAYAQTTREIYLDAREARINGMAAELAGALASGCSCPVCGSAEHPAPARAAGGAVGRVEEDQARRTHEDAAFAVQGHQVRVAGLVSEQDSLVALLEGQDHAALPGLRDTARTRCADLATTAADGPPASATATRIAGEITAAQRRAEELRVRAAGLAAELDERTHALTALAAERDALLGTAFPDLAALEAERQRITGALEHALTARDARDAAHAAAADDDAALRQAVAEAGFPDVAAALAAHLDPAAAHALADVVATTEARRMAAESTLADPEIRAAANLDLPDLERLADAHAGAARALRDAAATAAATSARATRVTELGNGLRAALATWAPLRAEHRLTADLAALVEGRSVDNPLRMRLAAYVLSERLRQVVAAANERLTRMTGGRYALEHTEDRGVGELRGGLSLRVRDDWNGVHRDPATLSGGETFVVSLALALGLADTVAHEAGGTDIDTLFIDEGFGSLDPDTLEDVMDTLDALRDGGRVVGLVSHVPELRSRITTQLEVAKGRTGSTLRPVHAGG